MSKLRPTLWRTCRVLASETRLEMLRLLFETGELCVSEMADLTKVSPHNASTQLRALNARGLITPRREKQKLFYRAEANENLDAAPILLNAVRDAFANKKSAEAIFHSCTAFTHERRIQIVRALANGPKSFGALMKETGILPSALWNHLEKLSDRGFVKEQGRLYRLRRVNDPFRRTLLQAVCS